MNKNRLDDDDENIVVKELFERNDHINKKSKLKDVVVHFCMPKSKVQGNEYKYHEQINLSHHE